MLALEERFWLKVEKGNPDECWAWQGTTDSSGYGILRRGRQRNFRAHRLSWEIHNGGIPEGLRVLHRCDNPPCVNPDHLFLGTQADNVADMDAKGRRRSPGLRGAANGRAKLGARSVRAIRERYAAGGTTYARLAGEFGVTKATIRRVINRETWDHVAA